MLDNKIYQETEAKISIINNKKTMDYETESQEIHLQGKTLKECFEYLTKIKKLEAKN